MTLLANLKPRFWDHVDVGQNVPKGTFNFRRIWKSTILLTAVVTILPLVVMAMIDYRVSQDAMESEILLRTSQLASNTRRSISFFLTERRSAIDFVIRNASLASLTDPNELARVLDSLKKGFGGFVDLGVIDDSGQQLTYSGPYDLAGKNYSDAKWFQQVAGGGIYVSDVFKGFRNIPHMVIAVRHERSAGGFYVLRATLDTQRFNHLLSGLDVGGQGDVFVVNRQGVLQTPSRSHGRVLDRIDLPVPVFAERTRVEQTGDRLGNRLVIGYAYIKDTPFVLMIVKEKQRLMAPWRSSRLRLIGFLLMSIVSSLVVILGGITYLVNQIYLADQRRLTAIHKIEYANKMASLGRLSAGVAHEINNPLAIINEKAGLIQDLFEIRDEYRRDEKLLGLVGAIIKSVERCADITHRLLNFARQSEMNIKTIDLARVLGEVLSFVEKEIAYRRITVHVAVADDIPPFKCDLGRLQEIVLNLLTNALAAVENDGGRLDITAERHSVDWVKIMFADNGHGIAKNDLSRVFEPFFSTKTDKGGTGLGLSITYRLVKDAGGTIQVDSKLGKGTTFTVRLPLTTDKPDQATGETKNDQSAAGG